MKRNTLPIVLLVVLVGALFAVGAAAATDGVQVHQTDDISTAQQGNITFTDQATASSTFTGASTSTPGVVVEAEANVESAVVVTYQNGSDLVIAGLDTFDAGNLTGGSVSIPVEDAGGFPGEHTAHLIPTANLSQDYAPGDNVSDETANETLDSETATVFEGDLDFADQTYEDATTEVTAATASLLGDEDTLFQVDLHAADETGAPAKFVGSSPVLSGANEDVSITLQNTSGTPLTFTTSDDYVAMLHVVDDESVEEGDQFPPGTFPVLPHASANGIVPGGVTDGGEVRIFSAEGAELSFDSQAVGIDDQGNAVVYVDNINEAEQVQQEDVSNPAEDFVVIYEGDRLTQNSLVDFRNIGDAQNGELVLDVADATPGEHTVELYADARFSTDPPQNDIDADHPMIEVITDEQEGTSGADSSDEYIVMLEEELTMSATADRQTAVQTLQQQAATAQAPVVDSIERMNGATVEQQYWITNAMLVSGDEVSPATLEGIDGVAHVTENIEAEHPSPAGENPAVSVDQNGNYTYGLEQIDVPGFEETFNTQGNGTSVAIIDDGLSNPQAGHPDLDIDIEASVEDGNLTNNTAGPADNGHGEHVAGTAVGTADPAGDVPRYSVAPGADLYNINVFEGTPGAPFANVFRAIEFSVTNDADVVSMSLGAAGSENSFLSLAVAEITRNANNAGTLVLTSAGNEGPGIVGTPGGEFNSFAIGASAESGAPGSFSSGDVITPNNVRSLGGPYPDVFPREYVKPDVSAPGVRVLSSGPLGGDIGDPAATYSYSSGTSMAAPHVAGAAALVQSATADQLEPKTIENALAETAEKPTTFFGGQNERDIRYGTGIINVTAATMAAQNTTTISGTITSNATDEPLTGVQVTTDTGATTATNESGSYSVTVTNDSSSTVVTAEDFGFIDETKTVPLDAGDQTADFALDPELDVVPVVGQPAFAEFQDSFNITVDVRNLEGYSVALTNAQGVTPSDINVTVAGETISPGESITLPGVSANGVPVVVDINGTFADGDQFALTHTFSGPGDDVSVTTGPTTLTENQEPAQFTLSNFDAPSEQPDPAQGIPYAPEVTVTNVGQTPGAAEIRWFAGPLGLQDDNPVEQLDPGESTTVALNFGEINFAGIFSGLPVQFLHGFDAAPQGAQSTGDMAFERFTVGSGLFPLLAPINPDQPRGAAETATVYDASVSLDRAYADPTSVATVSTSPMLPEEEEYVIVVHKKTAEGLPVIGNSGNLAGPQDKVTISLDQELNTTTDVVAMLHFPSDSGPFGAPIQAYDAAADAPTPVTDTAEATVGIDVNGNGLSATDPSNNGLLNDVDGDGDFDIFDLQTFWNHRNEPVVQNNPELFDFSSQGDGDVDIFDVQGLFNRLT